MAFGATGGGGGVAEPVAVPLMRQPHRQQVCPISNGIIQVKEGDGASDSFPDVRTLVETSYEDNDLTSLTWLQDRNLLKGMNLRSGDSLSPEGNMYFNDDEDASAEEDEGDGLKPIGGTVSPTSDYADSTSSGGGRQSPSPPMAGSNRRRQPVLLSQPTSNSLPIMTRLKLQHPSSNQSHMGQSAGNHRPYDPQVHVSSKPPFSFSCLIFMAIEDSPKKALPVKEIYAWILEHFPYFKDAPTGWKNSVRHNLSLNKCFKKVEKAPNLGKGSLWMVDDIFRPNLLQALRKAPFHPHTQLERVSVITNRLNVKSPSPPSDDCIVLSDAKSNCNVPDPELFPLLSRRLAAASGKDPPKMPADASNRRRPRGTREVRDSSDSGPKGPTYANDSLDDVDAAAAMLALKHGPHILFTEKDEWQPSEEGNWRASPEGRRARKISGKPSKTSQLLPVITSSPSEDHTYSAGRQMGLAATMPSSVWGSNAVGTRLPGPLMASSSPDEAFSEGSASSESNDSMIAHLSKGGLQHEGMECDPEEEQRRIVEGADALLNLAGICTQGRGCSGDRSVGCEGASGHELGPMLRGGKRRARARSTSPIDLSPRVKVRVGMEEAIQAPQVDLTPHSKQSSEGGVNRFLRAKKGWGGHWNVTGNKVSKTVGRMRVAGSSVALKERKKQVRRAVEDKMFRMKR
ncbi:forkhead box protein N3-like [Hetaerina americana]|uniref:forkhead box protein N3-like n=1 Tax=Hetaerina americana TaxID=62018 RepID=UPI003A7F2D89